MEDFVENDVVAQAIVISECQDGDVTKSAEMKGGFASHSSLQYTWSLELPHHSSHDEYTF